MIHPVVALPGIYEHEINPFYGAPQSAISDQFVDRGPDKMGFFLESAPVHPVLASLGFAGFGSEQGEFLEKLSHTGVILAPMVDGILPHDEGGTVSLRSDGRIKFDYPVGDPLIESFREAHKLMAELELAAGVKKAVSLHVDKVVVESKADIARFDSAEYGALKHSIFSAHQMGGCTMGTNPDTTVVDSTLRYHSLDNLFVVDGSVFPTALGVNPSQSVYGLASFATDAVASRT